MKHNVWLVIVALLGVMGFTLPVASAQGVPALTMGVRAGYDGAYRTAEWFPIEVELTNSGPDIQPILEWSFPGQPNERTFRHQVDLPRGSQKRITFSAYSRTFAQSGRLRVFQGTNQLAEQTIQLNTLSLSSYLFVVVSSDPALLNSLNSLRIGSTSVSVRHLDATSLPDSVGLLRSIDGLFLHDLDSSQFSPQQRAAISQWVDLGGTLVIGGGLNGSRAASGFETILPAEIANDLVQSDLAGLATLAKQAGPPTATTIAQLTARANAEALPPDQPLIYRWARGAGWVIQTSFDLAATRGWGGELDLWGAIFRAGETYLPGSGARQQSIKPLNDVLRLTAQSLPSVGSLLAMVLLYVLMIGPLNYLVLRRLRRLDWAWITIPGLVMVFSLGFYLMGFGLRGATPQLFQATIVQGREGDARGFASSFVGLFSPQRASYTLRYSAETFVSETRDLINTNRNLPVVSSDTAVEVQNVLVEVAAIETLIVEQPVDIPLQIESQIQIDALNVSGVIRNRGDQALEDVYVVRGDRFWKLGTIPPGGEAQVVAGSQRIFPDNADLTQIGNLDRRQFLKKLFDNDMGERFRHTDNRNPTGVYLLAWSNQSVVPVQLEQQTPEQEAITLYYLRLR